MNTNVYAGAIAKVAREGESVEEAWEWVTGMFKQPRPSDAQSFMPGGFFLEPENQPAVPSSPAVGEVFKGRSVQGTEVYVDITHCKLYRKLGYTEQYWDASEKQKGTPSIMRFDIGSHPGGTGALVEIRRAEKQTHSIKSRLFSAVAGGFDRNTAVGRLAFILVGQFAKGDSFESGSCKIVRDDSLKKLFS